MTYDLTAATMFHSHPLPYPNLAADLVMLGPKMYCLRFYQDNFSEFSDYQQTVIAEWAKEVLADMNKLHDFRMVWDIHERRPDRNDSRP